ncbi:MAG: RsmB/NOP family class I SAM-dependent RNA methyltransferase [Opitutus sp.]|nr:RsmB/NOP family class I SAM-dependent RNA methyltransferase [Opitutus sp.]
MTNIAANQKRTLLRLLGQLRPHWRRDAALPARIQSLLASHRAFGSRDRRLYRELIYTTLRYLPWIEPLLDAQPDEAVRRVAWLAAGIPAATLFRTEFAQGLGPAHDRTDLLPAWFRDDCPEIFSPAEIEAQLRRAPLWLRLQTADPDRVYAEFASLGWTWRPSTALPGAIELIGEVDITKSAAWQGGQIEVQDLGSQILLETIGINPGGHWLDACAGAGGKSLQLARLLGPTGTVDAHDVRPAALAELVKRAARAGVSNIHSTPRPRSGVYDGVVIDAPCSGSGTWRRAPHLKWITTAAQIRRAAETQLSLLHQFSALVKPGGRLVYATCSLSRRENEETVAQFLAAQPTFRPEPLANHFGFQPRGHGLTIMPSRHDTDGFFVASLRRAQI